MYTGDGAFSPRERRAALLALVGAALIVALGMLAQHWMQPSLGGTGVQASAPPPGVLQAQPLQG